MSIELEGFDEVLESLNTLFDYEKLDAALGRACAIVEADAKKKAPKGNGDLRRSITSKVNGAEGIIYTPLFYAPYVEYGTGLFAEKGGRTDVPWVYVEGSSKGAKSNKSYTEEEARATVEYLRSKGLDAHMSYGREPTPYMRPALYENREKIIRILKEGLTSD